MGKPRNTQKYPTYPEIPEIPGNTRKKKRYPEIPDRIFRHSYPTRTRPATRYFVQYPTRPDIEKPYPLGTAHRQCRLFFAMPKVQSAKCNEKSNFQSGS